MKKLPLIILMILYGCSKKTTAPPPPSYPVQITTVEQKDVPIYIDALGHVDPIITINIKSRIEGELTGVYFKQGRDVKKDDLLFTIDSKPYDASLKQAVATLDENKANLVLAEEKLKRYQLLTRDEYYSQIDFESLQANYAATLGQVLAAEAQVDSARINLDYCWIYAPIDGNMGILKVDYGNLVGVNDPDPLAILNQMQPIYVTFSVPEVRLPEIQKCRKDKTLKVLAAYEDFKKEVFEGCFDILNNQVDPKTGMIQLRAIFENTNRELWPGQFIRCRLILYTQENALVIPYTAVQQTTKGPIVFCLAHDMTVKRRNVKLGFRQEEKIVVLEGLNAGETIVLEGQINLSDGAKVHIPKEGSANEVGHRDRARRAGSPPTLRRKGCDSQIEVSKANGASPGSLKKPLFRGGAERDMAIQNITEVDCITPGKARAPFPELATSGSPKKASFFWGDALASEAAESQKSNAFLCGAGEQSEPAQRDRFGSGVPTDASSEGVQKATAGPGRQFIRPRSGRNNEQGQES